MKKQFSTCLLIQGSSFASELLETEVNLHPGCGFSPDQGGIAFFAGGFSLVSPESGFPLSPTLRFNHDSTIFANREPAEIACAELQRVAAICAACKSMELFEVHRWRQ